jgi:hypothetical protein
MGDIAFLAHLKDEPLALIVLGGVVLIKIIEYLIKYAPVLFARFFLKEKRMTTYEWQNFVSERLNTIESTLLTHEFLLDKTSEGTLENMLFDDNPDRSAFQKLKAFRRLLAMKKNGRIWERGIELILQNKKVIKDADGKILTKTDVWLDVLDTELGIPIVDVEYYEARLKEIRRRFYDDFSEK